MIKRGLKLVSIMEENGVDPQDRLNDLKYKGVVYSYNLEGERLHYFMLEDYVEECVYQFRFRPSDNYTFGSKYYWSKDGDVDGEEFAEEVLEVIEKRLLG